MALKHIIKHTETEIIFKCYITESSGGNIDLSVQNDMTKSTQVYVAPTSVPDETGGGLVNYTGSRVYITGVWWGLKKDKQLDITRIINPTGPVLHGHYYLIGAGNYDFNVSGAFSDRVYANKDIRMNFDGPGHCIIRLRKEGWTPKVEESTFGSYDDPTRIGASTTLSGSPDRV
jgi:hypothetical protein